MTDRAQAFETLYSAIEDVINDDLGRAISAGTNAALVGWGRHAHERLSQYRAAMHSYRGFQPDLDRLLDLIDRALQEYHVATRVLIDRGPDAALAYMPQAKEAWARVQAWVMSHPAVSGPGPTPVSDLLTAYRGLTSYPVPAAPPQQAAPLRVQARATAPAPGATRQEGPSGHGRSGADTSSAERPPTEPAPPSAIPPVEGPLPPPAPPPSSAVEVGTDRPAPHPPPVGSRVEAVSTEGYVGQGAAATLRGGEALVLLGGGVVLAAFVVFTMVLGSLWSFSLAVVMVPLSGLCVVLVEVQRRQSNAPGHAANIVLLTASLLLGLIGAVGLLILIRLGDRVGTGGLETYFMVAGAVVVGAGGLMILRDTERDDDLSRGRP
jgi:hypothetical protein